MRIYFDGDSITACYDANTNKNDLLGFSVMVQNSFAHEFVNNAVPGCTSKDLLDRLKFDVKYDVFILQIGANDAWNKIKEGVVTSNEVFHDNLNQIVMKCFDNNSDCKVILQTIATSSNTELLEEVKNKNEVIRSFVDKNCIIVDSFEIINNSTEAIDELFYPDTIHLKPKAHVLIAKQLNDLINNFK